MISSLRILRTEACGMPWALVFTRGLRVGTGVFGVWASLLLALGTVWAQEEVTDRVSHLRRASVGGSLEARFQAIDAVVEGGSAAYPALLEALAHRSPAVREDAARALGRLGVSDALGPLVRLLQNDTVEVRSAAAEALGDLGQADAAGALVEALASDSEMVRRGAAVALGDLRAAAAVGTLEQLCRDGTWEEVWRACIALGKIGNASSAPTVSRLVNHSQPVVAACADWAVGALAGRPDPGALSGNLRSGDAGVIWASAWALGVIGSDASRAVLAEAASGAGTAADAAELVLLWLGAPVVNRDADEGGAKPVTQSVAAARLLDLEGRWMDRYGALQIEVARPAVIQGPAGKPLRTREAPHLVSLPCGDILLSYVPAGESSVTCSVLRSRDGAKSWESQATLVQRLSASAALDNGSALVYDGVALATGDRAFELQTCISRDGGRTFGPLQPVIIAAGPDVAPQSLPEKILGSRPHAVSAGVRLGIGGLRGQVAACGNGVLVGCGPREAFSGQPAGVVCYRSSDYGLSWQEVSFISEEGVGGGGIVATAGDRLVCMVSEGEAKPVWVYESADQGGSWWRTVAVSPRGTAAAVARLEGGPLACSYVAESVTVVFNADGKARHWTDRIAVEALPVGDPRATALCALSGNRLLLVYSAAAEQDPSEPVLKACVITATGTTAEAP